MKFFSLLATTLVLGGAAAQSQTDAAPQQPTQTPAAGVQLRTFSALGCFSDPGSMWDMGPYTYQTDGWCQPLCVRQAATYFALVNGTNCFCGTAEPDSQNKVSSSECDTTCNGFDTQNCGGNNRWAVYADGFRNGDSTGTIHITIPTQTWFGHAATGSSTTLKTVTGGHTVVVTAPAATASGAAASSTPAAGSSSGSGPNKAAIAAGVVVGVVGLAAIVGAAAFYFRLKKKRELDDERRRHESIMRIVSKGEKPSSFSAGSDSRLEPSVMFQRRQSDGSIMDNQDYSRRILKVTNPDWRESRLH